MDIIEIRINDIPRIKRELNHMKDEQQLLRALVGMIDMAEYHKFSAKSMSKDLSSKSGGKLDVKE